MQKFYLTLASGSQIKTSRLLQYPNILINFMTKNSYPPKYKYQSLFVDSGGFYSSMVSGHYTKKDSEYLEYVEHYNPDYFALRDYPCEPELLKKYKRTAKDHINMTIDNHIKLMDMLPEFNITGQAIPVIQGWNVDDYIYCIEQFNAHGMIRDYMAIGSVCRRTAVDNIRNIVVSIKENLPIRVKLHGFGVKLTALKDLSVWKSLYSTDSGAWDYSARWKVLRGEGTIPEESLKAGVIYIEKLNRIHNKHDNQKLLTDFKQRILIT